MKQETIDIIWNSRFLLRKKCNSDDDIKDILQDATLKLLQNGNIENLAGDEKRKYINRCIMNSYADFVRKKKAQKRGCGVILISESENLHELNNRFTKPDVFSKIELKEVMEKARQHRSFDTLRLFAEGYSNKEIAAMTGANINTVLGRCRYVRLFLKKT